MARRIAAITILSILCTAAVVVASQPDQGASRESYASQKEQQQTIIAVVNNQERDAHPDKANGDAPKWYATPEWWLTGLGVFTLIALVYQANEMRKATVEMRSSAQAALRMATIAGEKERPRLVLHKIGFGDMGAANFEAALQYPKVQICVMNYGHTPAFLKCFDITIAIDNRASNPTYSGGQLIYFPPEKVVNHGQEYCFYVRPDKLTSTADIEGIVNREKIMTVRGTIWYEDFFGPTKWDLRVCRQLTFITPTIEASVFLDAFLGTEGHGPQKSSNNPN
jgi:hypothetical protein